MKEIIKKNINQWDPLDLFPYAPNDEYELEIKEITNFFSTSKCLSSDILGKQIYEIFMKTLGGDIFINSIDECYKIAEKILYEVSCNRVIF